MSGAACAMKPPTSKGLYHDPLLGGVIPVSQPICHAQPTLQIYFGQLPATFIGQLEIGLLTVTNTAKM